jgi:hypothetical protein
MDAKAFWQMHMWFPLNCLAQLLYTIQNIEWQLCWSTRSKILYESFLELINGSHFNSQVIFALNYAPPLRNNPVLIRHDDIWVHQTTPNSSSEHCTIAIQVLILSNLCGLAVSAAISSIAIVDVQNSGWFFFVSYACANISGLMVVRELCFVRFTTPSGSLLSQSGGGTPECPTVAIYLQQLLSAGKTYSFSFECVFVKVMGYFLGVEKWFFYRLTNGVKAGSSLAYLSLNSSVGLIQKVPAR